MKGVSKAILGSVGHLMDLLRRVVNALQAADLEFDFMLLKLMFGNSRH